MDGRGDEEGKGGREGLLQMLEDGRWDLCLVGAGGVFPMLGVFGAGFLHHPPVYVEDCECEGAGGAVLVCFDCGTACTVEEFGLGGWIMMEWFRGRTLLSL